MKGTRKGTNYTTLLGVLRIELNSNGHLPGCICPECPDYDEDMNKFIEDMLAEEGDE